MELTKAIKLGYGKDIASLESGSVDLKMVESLKNNCYQFSAAKNYQQLKDITAAIVDQDGNVRKFSDFKRIANDIAFQYNETWLATEYNTAISSAQMASSWVDFVDRSDAQPNLQYVTAGDDRVREEHAMLDGIIKPIDDPFWDTYYPPNDFNCRCDVIQLPDDSDQISQRAESDLPDIKPMFSVNLAKEGLAFPPAHPYYIGLPDNLK